jgi:hypothetical protein
LGNKERPCSTAAPCLVDELGRRHRHRAGERCGAVGCLSYVISIAFELAVRSTGAPLSVPWNVNLKT